MGRMVAGRHVQLSAPRRNASIRAYGDSHPMAGLESGARGGSAVKIEKIEKIENR
jgi:hypothetical protein